MTDQVHPRFRGPYRSGKVPCDLHIGDRVRVVFPDAMFSGREGTVTGVHHDNPAAESAGCPILDVKLDNEGDTIIIPAKAVAPLKRDQEALRAAVRDYLSALVTAPGTAASQKALDHMATLVDWPVAALSVLSAAERFRSGGVGHPEYDRANGPRPTSSRMKGGTEPTCPACFGEGRFEITCELCAGSGSYDLSPSGTACAVCGTPYRWVTKFNSGNPREFLFSDCECDSEDADD
jgi:hypothetical protein